MIIDQMQTKSSLHKNKQADFDSASLAIHKSFTQ